MKRLLLRIGGIIALIGLVLIGVGFAVVVVVELLTSGPDFIPAPHPLMWAGLLTEIGLVVLGAIWVMVGVVFPSLSPLDKL